MLETPEERVRLLRTGLTGKEIEKLYIEKNEFKIVEIPLLFEIVELDMQYGKKICMSRGIAAEYMKSFFTKRLTSPAF